MKSPSILIFIFFFFVSVKTNANDIVTGNIKECDRLITEGDEAIKRMDYVGALEPFTKAEMLAERNQWKDRLFKAKNGIGSLYISLANYGEALGYWQQALDLAKELGSEDKIAKINNNFGLLYSYEKDYKNAIIYFKIAYEFDGYTKFTVGVNLSDAYNNLGNFAEARRYLMEIEKLKAPEFMKQMWKINYAESFFLEGNPLKALEILDQSSSGTDEKCYFCVVELLSRIYGELGKTAEAISFAKQGLQSEVTTLERSKLYNQLFNLYLKNQDYETAILYKDSVMQTKDSIAVRVNRGLYETNKVKWKVKEYQNELITSNEKRETERNFFIVIFTCCVVVFFSIYKGLKNKMIKQKQQRIIAEGNEKILNLELQKKSKENLLTEKQLETVKSRALLKQERLKNEIAEKNRRLSAKALYLSGRNELIGDVVNALSQIPEMNKNKQVSTYLKTLSEYLRTDAEWEEFVEHFEKVNPGLLKTLKRKHPDLTAKDIRFLCYVYMNLDAKEISIVFNITPDACRRRERRLRQKMGLDEEKSLFDYLLSLSV